MSTKILLLLKSITMLFHFVFMHHIQLYPTFYSEIVHFITVFIDFICWWFSYCRYYETILTFILCKFELLFDVAALNFCYCYIVSMSTFLLGVDCAALFHVPSDASIALDAYTCDSINFINDVSDNMPNDNLKLMPNNSQESFISNINDKNIKSNKPGYFICSFFILSVMLLGEYCIT